MSYFSLGVRPRVVELMARVTRAADRLPHRERSISDRCARSSASCLMPSPFLDAFLFLLRRYARRAK